MKRLALALGLTAALFGSSACKKQVNENDAIRAGILQHLTAIGTLNMSAMDIDLRSVSINGNQAHAEVEFRPRTGGVPGAGMHVAYNLEKRDAAWVVAKSQSLGGMIQHPDPGQNPHTNQDVHSEAMPNFNELLNPSGAPALGTLPAGHPPVKSQAPSSPPSGQSQTPPSKPN
jgi:hypothetical protein